MTQTLRTTMLTAAVTLLLGGMAITAHGSDSYNADPSGQSLLAWVSPPPDYRPAPRPYPPPYPSHYRQPPPEYNPAIDPRQLEADLIASRAELQRAQERLAVTQGLLQQAREALSINYTDHQQQRAAQDDQTQQLKAATAEADAAQARITELTAELQTVRAALDEQQARVSEFAALEQEQVQSSGAMEQLRTDITGLEELKNKVESQYQSCQEQLATNKVDLDSAQANQTKVMQSLTEMQTERDRLQAELSNMTAELEKRQTDLDSANASVSTVIAERDALQAKLANTTANADKAETEQSTKLAEELKTAQTTLEAELAAKTALQQALADAVSTRERLLTQLDDLNTQLAGTVAEEQSTQGLLQQQLTACNERLVAAKAAISASTVSASETPVDGAANTYAVEMAALESAPVAAASVDRDADGIADSKDLCPASPASAVVDAMGCTPDMPIALEGVNFKYDSDALTTPSRAALDQVAAILREQPTLKLEIAGHSDTQGDAAYNLWLSEERAKSVMTYLVSQGVSAAQLSSQGYGGSQPIADNSTREGLARNRRVELRRQP